MRLLRVLNWNIGNPSRERAEAQAKVILSKNPDLLCLTETKESAGCRHLADQLQANGYHLHFPTPPVGEYGALLGSKYPFTLKGTLGPLGQEARAPRATLADGTDIIGLYVPSNAQTPEKLQRKMEFLRHLKRVLEDVQGKAILLADLNTVPTNHLPAVPFLTPDQTAWVDDLLRTWQDALADDPGPTWISWRGEQYRYDYCLVKGIQTKEGQRIPDLRGRGLSDHMGTGFVFATETLASGAAKPQWRFM